MQYGFFFDQTRCVGCRTCSTACKAWKQLPPGPLKPLKMYEYEKGSFPDVRLHFMWVPCYHCEEPACVEACPFEAIKKDEKFGTVLIDKEKCVGCRLCYEACPYGAPIFAADKVSKRQKNGEKGAPCTEACPAGVNVPQYVGYIREGKPAEAVATLREKLPFPSVCGRICFHPCEKVCNRTKLDDKTVAIRALKRYATENDTGVWKRRVKKVPGTGKKVAVVGSGPAGLSASYYLAKKGHDVTVFEELPKAGGMMRVGIPEYRLPKGIIDEEIAEIKKVGVKIKVNSKVESIDSLLDQGFDAVFLAIGAHRATQPGVEGEKSKGVIDAVTFLKNNALGKKQKVGNNVVVIGGGNVAIDSARTALRLGAKNVNLVCLESLAEMPAFKEEVEGAIKEGVKVNCSWGISKITCEMTVNGVECKECTSVFDGNGRFNPKYNENVKTAFDADTVILAIGQEADIPAGFNLQTTRSKTIMVDNNMATDRKGVFAGGDVARVRTPITALPASVISAIASGRKAAGAIDEYLGGNGNIDEVLAKPIEHNVKMTQNDVKRKQVRLKELAKSARIKSFAEVEQPMDDRAAKLEAKRCFECDSNQALKCDMCIDRLEKGEKPVCVISCSPRALDFGPLEELQAAYGDKRDIEDMPSSTTTKPAVIFKAHVQQRPQIVPYNSEKAIKLMMNRDPAPPIFTSVDDVKVMPEGTVGRSKLVLKHKNAAEVMKYTRCDDG